MADIRSIIRIVLKYAISVVLLVIVYWFMAWFASSTGNSFVGWVNAFLIANFGAIILVMFIEMLADITEIIRFPFNIPFPFLKTISVGLSLYILFRLIGSGIAAYDPFYAITFMVVGLNILFIVCAIVFIVSVFKLVFAKKGNRTIIKEKIIIREKEVTENKDVLSSKKLDVENKPVKEDSSTPESRERPWKMVGEEFKSLILDSIVKVRKKIKGDRK